MNKSDYDNGVLKILRHSKFKALEEDPTLLQESRLQRYLRKLKVKRHLDSDLYCKIYPSGSQQARMYGIPMMQKPATWTQLNASVQTYMYMYSVIHGHL